MKYLIYNINLRRNILEYLSWSKMGICSAYRILNFCILLYSLILKILRFHVCIYFLSFRITALKYFLRIFGERIHLHPLLYSPFRLKPNVYASKINRSDTADLYQPNAFHRMHLFDTRQSCFHFVRVSQNRLVGLSLCRIGGWIFRRAIGHSFKTARFSPVAEDKNTETSPEECRVI